LAGVSENCPDALRLLDTEDLHCLRRVRILLEKCFEEGDLLKEEVAKGNSQHFAL
jgi:hypothetical protein